MNATELRLARHNAIQTFLDANAEIFGITEVDECGDGPFMLTEWMLVLHNHDLSVDVTSTEPMQVRALFFKPGMGYSHKLGMVESCKELLQFPNASDD